MRSWNGHPELSLPPSYHGNHIPPPPASLQTALPLYLSPRFSVFHAVFFIPLLLRVLFLFFVSFLALSSPSPPLSHHARALHICDDAHSASTLISGALHSSVAG